VNAKDFAVALKEAIELLWTMFLLFAGAILVIVVTAPIWIPYCIWERLRRRFE